MVMMEIWKLLVIVILIGEEMLREANQEYDMYSFWLIQLFLGIASCNMLWHYQMQRVSIMQLEQLQMRLYG
jgi:hypothetical protein